MTPNNLPCIEGDPNLMLIFGALRPIIVHIFLSKGHALRKVTVRRGLDRPDNCGGGAGQSRTVLSGRCAGARNSLNRRNARLDISPHFTSAPFSET